MLKKPAWKQAESDVMHIGPGGGEVAAGHAKIVFHSDAPEQVHDVKLQHLRPSEHQHPKDALVRISGEEVQLGDRVVVSIKPQPIFELEPTGAQPSGAAASSNPTGTVSIPVDVPPGKPKVDLYASPLAEDGKATNFQRVTDSTGVKLVKVAQGASHLAFNTVPVMAGLASAKAASMVYDVVWVSSLTAAWRIHSAIARFLSGDEVPLHIRFHYVCNPHGDPYHLQTVIAAGAPPPPDAQGMSRDGLYTADSHEWETECKPAYISSRDHLRVRIEPKRVTPSWMASSAEYAFTKPLNTAECHYYHHGMNIISGNSTPSIRDDEWKFLVTVEKNGKIIGKEKPVVVICRQVSDTKLL